MKSKAKGIEVHILIFLVTIEAAGALFGGYSLIKDPSGEAIKLPLKLLNGTFFPDYLVPGIILFVMLGLFPLLLIYPLYFKPRWKFANKLNIYIGYHWAWTYTLYTSIILLIWINLQMMILGTGSMMQGATGMFGILILIVTLLPQVKNFYRINSNKKREEMNRNEER
jgi:hypothetical protein